MSVLVDTTIWSLAFRRQSHTLTPNQRQLLAEWQSLVAAGEACLIGPIRQEILSGIRTEATFAELRDRLQYFDHIEIVREDYDRASAFFNVLRTRGVVGSPTDLLICAVAHRCDMPIFTTDSDFSLFAKHVAVHLHAI